MTGHDLEAIARELVPPVGVNGVCAVVENEPGGCLASGQPNGIGGRTRYRAAWVIGGRRSVPVGPAFERQRDAYRLIDLMAGVTPGHPAASAGPIPPGLAGA